MADRRMFSQKIIDSDAFLDMPLSTQALYFHLSMRADDEGFVNNPRKIQRMISATEDDLKVLITKNYIIPFESGIIVIKHWKVHNLIQSDRFHETVYTDEKALLEVGENKVYRLKDKPYTDCIQDGYETDTQVSIGKISIDKASLDKASLDKGNGNDSGRFQPPTLEEVISYCKERNNRVDPQRFMDFYTSKGWKVGNTQMTDWKAKVRDWETNGRNKAVGANGVKLSNEVDHTLDGIL